ncbi:MAG TPA: HAD-IC family P-type ATPase [Burkholderiaceae bacterium]|nr:HAD-IC family P-type ATPase [Burkholderiaceae bacterium]
MKMPPNRIVQPPLPQPAEPFHARSADETLDALDSGSEGLPTAEAASRLERYGANVLPRAKRDTPLELLGRQINNPLIWVLVGAGGVAILADWHGEGLKNGVVILATVAINTLIGFVQEFKAGKAIEALSSMVPEQVAMMRDGRKTTLPASQLVPGDVVMLASGDKVPADMRLLDARSLRVEEAALTGESVPAEKQTEAIDAAALVGDRTNMAFAGTLVTYGTGTAVVVRTGAVTELGKISAMLKETTDLRTPLTAALAKVGKYLTVAILLVSVAVLAAGTVRTEWATGQGLWPSFRETLIFAIALAVGAIPEGLPAIVTIALAIGVQRMVRRRAVIRKLPAVETLGSTTVICSDKTGTLTRNEMTVTGLWTPGGGRYAVTGAGYEPKGQLLKGEEVCARPPGDVIALLRCGALCSDATTQRREERWSVTGDPTEAALVVAGEKLGLDVEAERRSSQRLDAIPFESEHQYMATLNATSHAPTIHVKGAPEVVLARCVGVDARQVMAEVEHMAAQGMRVLAFATRPAPGSARLEPQDVAGGCVLLGLQGMIDPPRTEAVEAIRLCHLAGIDVKMITGDHKLTALAIGRQIAIADASSSPLTGADLARMDDLALREAVKTTNVFARVAPEHKLKLVRALQANGEVVAMTGDGVNDAPALKQANIGVAMGITGTSVSKESAAVVLTDDNFASIAAAVEEGRRVYDNLVKSLAFVLPTNLGLAMILVCAVALFPFDAASRELLLPMAPTQLLWINVVASVALALPLALEAKEPNVMSRPPRRPDAPLFGAFVVTRTFVAAALMTAGAIGLFLYEYDLASADEAALAKAQTMAVTTVVMFQIFYMLTCRSLRGSILRIGVFSNPAVFVGIAAIIALQLAFIYTPSMQALFGTAALSARDLALSVLAGTIILPVVGLEKRLVTLGERRPACLGTRTS